MAKNKKKSRDVNVLASQIVEEATGEPTPKPQDSTKNPAAVALGRLGGLKGGKARAEKLTPEQRTEISKKAAQARWSK
ncbi:histone H1 [Chloroflexota bacterium]